MSVHGGPRKTGNKLSSFDESTLRLTLLPEFGEIEKNETKEISVMASITSKAFENHQDKRNPLELVVVLDKSGSMSGKKLNLCKSSLEFLIGELTTKDRLSLVLFDSNVEISFPLTEMNDSGKDLALNKVKQIQAGSMTNLSGGLLQGLDFLVTSSKENEHINCTRSIILLTDGLMNEGITDRKILARICEKSLAEIKGGASISVFGYGTDADVAAGTEISQVGKGMFYAIVEIDQVATSFAGALGGLLSVSAQNIQMTFTLDDGCIFSAEPLTKFTVLKNEKKDNQCIVIIPDFYSEETRDILFTVLIPKLKIDDNNNNDNDTISTLTKVGTCCVKFLDVQYEKLNEISDKVFVNRVTKVVDVVVNPQVQTQKLRVQVAKDLENAKNLADKGDFTAAKGILKKTNDQLKSLGITEEAEGIAGELANDINLSYDLMGEKDYHTKGTSLMASKAMGHYFQRSVQTHAFADESSEPKSGMFRKSAYTGSMQMQMMKKASPAPSVSQSAPKLPLNSGAASPIKNNNFNQTSGIAQASTASSFVKENANRLSKMIFGSNSSTSSSSSSNS